ncbi:MAG: protein phosphatase 2C domain-containing protein [Muribaculaceae bacterium]|nr:protein phosphatase 2C domain-containing protein [Muribaculaceae bacterium]
MEITLKQPYSFYQIGKRGNQEDARFPDENMPQGCQPVFVVCDGVGGQDKGEVASRTVADAIGEYMHRFDLSQPFTRDDFSRVLKHAYSAVEKKMTRDTRGMATTMTFVCFSASGVFCAHIGDSRIYQIRPEVGIMYRSEDHSLVNALVHSGNITPEEAIDHPQSNIITRCIGYVESDQEPSAATALQITDVEAGDYFFLCTDGVLHCLDDDAIYDIISSSIPDADKIRRMADLCRFSSDNNTAFLIGVEGVDREGSAQIEEDEDHVDNSDSTTSPIEVEMDRVWEVSPAVAKEGNPISRFFKNLFS